MEVKDERRMIGSGGHVPENAGTLAPHLVVAHIVHR